MSLTRLTETIKLCIFVHLHHKNKLPLTKCAPFLAVVAFDKLFTFIKTAVSCWCLMSVIETLSSFHSMQGVLCLEPGRLWHSCTHSPLTESLTVNKFSYVVISLNSNAS